MKTISKTLFNNNIEASIIMGSKEQVRKNHFASKIHAVLFTSFTFQIITDIIAIILSYITYNWIKFESGIFDYLGKPGIDDYLVIIFIMIGYWLMLFFLSGLYKNWYIRSPFDELYSLLKVSFFGCLIIFLIVYLDSLVTVRLLFLIYFANFFIFAGIGRHIARRLQRKLRIKRIIAAPSIIIGSSAKVKKLYNDVEQITAWGFLPIGVILTDNEDFTSLENNQMPILGNIGELNNILNKFQPKEVLITAEHLDFKTLFNIASLCSEKNIGVKIQPDLYNIVTGQTRTLHIYGIPLIDISPFLLKPWEQFIKRSFDIIFSLIIIFAGMPLWLLIALAIKIESKGPILFKQTRIGKNGKEFLMLKFRSMIHHADKQLNWTTVNDPRVTKIGKILRKTHFDEIPQFWNALTGDMSIVGPRPEQPQLVSQFSSDIPYYKRRLKVRPGITGWWQVKYQPFVLNKEEVENRLKDDFYYIENMSLKFDIEIIFRTVWCVLKGHGQT